MKCHMAGEGGHADTKGLYVLMLLTLMVPAEPELRAEDAHAWTHGRVVFADRVRRINTPVPTADGSAFSPGAHILSLFEG